MASNKNSGMKNIVIIGGAVILVAVIWHYTKRPAMSPAPVAAVETVETDLPLDVPGSLSAIADMQMEAFDAFATPENLKDIQNSVKYTVEIIKDGMREQKIAEDEIELIDDLPEADEIVKKEGWLEKDKATQKEQLQTTDTSLKKAYIDLLGGTLPAQTREKYDAYKANGTIKFPIIID